MADPETPVGARGVGEPPVGAGYGAVMNAIADAVGDESLPAGAGHGRRHSDVARERQAHARAVTRACMIFGSVESFDRSNSFERSNDRRNVNAERREQ